MMMRLAAPRRASVLTFVAAVLLLGATGSAQDVVLLTIDRVQSVSVPPEIVAALSPVLELRTVWIVSAPSSVVSRLRQLGVSFRVLDPPVGRKTLQLLRTQMDDPARQIDGVARAWLVEEGLWLVAGAAELSRDQLPDDATIETVPDRLNVPLVFETAGSQPVPDRSAPSAVTAEPRVQALLALVSKERLAAHVRNLESYQTRYTLTSNARAAGESLYRQLVEIGVDVRTEEFVSGNVTVSNVIVTIPGRVSPNEVVVVGAHYDSYARNAFLTTAPGADDNASGTAGVMEMARVLAGQSFDFTIRLVAFAAEETGLNGSRDYATRASRRGERVVAMLDMDMIGYADRMPEDVDVTANPASAWLADYYASTAAAYTGLAVRRIVDASSRSSDHAPFWDQGYSAVEIIEDVPVVSPYYHTTDDRFDTLNMDFATEVVRTTLAVATSLAQSPNSPAPPALVQVRTQVSRSLFSNLETTTIQWDRSADTAVGYNLYEATASHGEYRRVNATPISGTSFVQTRFFRATTMPEHPFYVVTTVDASGRESNRSMEVHSS
jgi:hypothetical protein